MNILGFNVGHNTANELARDGGAALLIDGVIVGAIAEERLTRDKHCGGHTQAVEMLLERSQIAMADVDLVVVSCYGEEPRIELFGDLGIEGAKQKEIVSHHLAHAYSAYFPSGYEDALVLIADNEGNILGRRTHTDLWKNAMERLSMYRGVKNKIHLLERDMKEQDVVSLGELYGNMTRYMGFESYLNAGKTMALASFGDASRFSNVPLVRCLPEGRLECPLHNDYLNSSEEIRRYFDSYGHKLPPQRDPDTDEVSPLWEDLAAAIQKQLEDGLLHKVRHWSEKTGLKSLCLAGGIALNCVANRRLLDETPLDRLYVQPNSGDQGLALGNVLYGWHELMGMGERVEIPGAGVYLGGEYNERQCLEALSKRKATLDFHRSYDILGEAAKMLTEGAVVGWYQGRSEWGARALGNRSILADPRSVTMRDRINAKVKHREAFRPFAPVVMWDYASQYFQLIQEVPTMTVVARVREEVQKSVPAIVHVDGTARVQTVTAEQNSKLYDLIERFRQLTGVPVLLNTSFNDRGEPIVETPEDALRCFESTDIDALILGDLIVLRKEH